MTVKSEVIETQTTIKSEVENDSLQTTENTFDGVETTKARSRGRITIFSCDNCGEIFKNTKLLINHCKDEHGMARSAVRPFKCLQCDRRFPSSSNLGQHEKLHVGEKKHICTFCGRGFVRGSDLKVHEKTHLNQREYKCPFCGESFNALKNLRIHKIIKHVDRSTWNYQCEQCGRRFHTKSNYDAHMRRHYGEKPFPCTICQKPFVTKDELKKHLISHTNIRAFQCPHCDREYKENRVLKVHLTAAHGVGNSRVPMKVKRHKCELCGTGFYYKNKLERHMRTHTGERPFPCGLCNKRFTDNAYLSQHVRLKHGGGECDMKEED